jgi:hypothetical protein
MMATGLRLFTSSAVEISRGFTRTGKNRGQTSEVTVRGQTSVFVLVRVNSWIVFDKG